MPIGSISTLNCAGTNNGGSLTAGSASSGVSISLPYTGGNGGSYSSQSISSTGVTGLTATLSAGNFVNGNNSVFFTISGTPSAAGTASFFINIGGQSCSFSLNVAPISSYPAGSVFCTSVPTAIVDVFNPTTGKTWMDRNLGASRAAISMNDTAAYGDLYQWGRRSDGHQCRNSIPITILSSVDQPVNGNFIHNMPNSTFEDWRSPQNDNLWQGLNGVNNPCPAGYRLPTFIELNAERMSWSVNLNTGAFASPLKFPAAGSRSHVDGMIYNIGSMAVLWSSDISNSRSWYLVAAMLHAGLDPTPRGNGLSVRCIKNY